ncbi:hypothetical protein SPI_01921 [Niveomyces insectorum RCEF 264]|uniref:Uncharacterized protein n=1 Tax=Niveomyces insectorum RCEF 264 TaxID=1081102 RepID=A0A167ZCE6_9HYPO|nr:hypothetical protein SPI_01921 [Niveomyces insectorum RCEF 264]
MVTVLEMLAKANPKIDTEAVKPGLNTFSDELDRPDGWLQSPYRGKPVPVPDALPLDLKVCNEPTLQLVLDRFTIPAVNNCLHSQSSGCHYGPGARCDDSIFKPDWSCNQSHAHDINVLPADTKLSKKWAPAMATSRSISEVTEWSKVLGQIISYMKSWQARYGFIITDKHFVVLRITRHYTGAGLAAGRAPRAAAAAAAAAVSDHTMNSSGFDPSYANTTASFVDDNPSNWDVYDPEYAVIPWSRHGRGKLTIKLALWCLAMMAANGDRYVDYEYPGLHTWRIEENASYVHNTSGERKRSIGRRDVLDSRGSPYGMPGTGHAVEQYYQEEEAVIQSEGNDQAVAEATGDGGDDDGVAAFSHLAYGVLLRQEVRRTGTAPEWTDVESN